MKEIKGYERLYGITSCGKVWSFMSNKFLEFCPHPGGYKAVSLCGNKQLVHRLVAEAYIPNPNNFDTVDHIDGIKTHNYIKNLQWMSRGDNTKKAHDKKVMCVETGEIFDSFIAAAKSINRDKSGISACIRGKQKTCGGYHWKVVTK